MFSLRRKPRNSRGMKRSRDSLIFFRGLGVALSHLLELDLLQHQLVVAVADQGEDARHREDDRRLDDLVLEVELDHRARGVRVDVPAGDEIAHPGKEDCIERHEGRGRVAAREEHRRRRVAYGRDGEEDEVEPDGGAGEGVRGIHRGGHGPVHRRDARDVDEGGEEAHPPPVFAARSDPEDVGRDRGGEDDAGQLDIVHRPRYLGGEAALGHRRGEDVGREGREDGEQYVSGPSRCSARLGAAPRG